MDDLSVSTWRRRRLQELLDEKFSGNAAQLGRALDYKDGAFVRQMLAGRRPITEKTVQAVEALPMRGVAGWFSRGSAEADVSADARRVAAQWDGLSLDERRKIAGLFAVPIEKPARSDLADLAATLIDEIDDPQRQGSIYAQLRLLIDGRARLVPIEAGKGPARKASAPGTELPTPKRPAKKRD